MTFNMFAGARRIALGLGALCVLGCLLYVILQPPDFRIFYAIPWPGEKPVRATECADEDATRYLDRNEGVGDFAVTLCFTAHKAQDGRLLVPYAAVTVPEDSGPWNAYRQAKPSDRPREGEGKRMFELFAALEEAQAKNDMARTAEISAQIEAISPSVRTQTRYLMNEEYHENVRKYVAATVKSFTVPKEDLKEIQQGVWNARLQQWKVAALVLIAVLASGWVVVAAIGWVMRGFLGIPRGKDTQVNEAN
jgi:hypothetical protein